jgi:hypothetical protein
MRTGIDTLIASENRKKELDPNVWTANGVD